MSDPSDPPRKFYRMKPKEFERVNEVPSERRTPPAAGEETGRPPGGAGDEAVRVEPDAGPAEANPNPAAPPPDHGSGRIEVRDLVRLGSAGAPLLGSNQVRTTANDVHTMLAQNEAIADAHGLNAVKPVRKFRRRKRDFRVLLVGGNLFIPALYLAPNFIAYQVQALASRQVPDLWKYTVFVLSNPPMFVLPIAIMIFYSGLLVWLMFGVMDDY
jgi:hypothetical protein